MRASSSRYSGHARRASTSSSTGATAGDVRASVPARSRRIRATGAWAPTSTCTTDDSTARPVGSRSTDAANSQPPSADHTAPLSSVPPRSSSLRSAPSAARSHRSASTTASVVAASAAMRSVGRANASVAPSGANAGDVSAGPAVSAVRTKPPAPSGVSRPIRLTSPAAEISANAMRPSAATVGCHSISGVAVMARGSPRATSVR
jgi:hypothetical protein